MGWYGSAYQLARYVRCIESDCGPTDLGCTSATLLPLTGKLYANFDSKVSTLVPCFIAADFLKWTFLAFFGLFELGSLVCGVASSSKMLIIGRAVAGLGASGIQNGAFTIIAECVPMAKRPGMSQDHLESKERLKSAAALTGIVLGCKSKLL